MEAQRKWVKEQAASAEKAAAEAAAAEKAATEEANTAATADSSDPNDDEIVAFIIIPHTGHCGGRDTRHLIPADLNNNARRDTDWMPVSRSAMNRNNTIQCLHCGLTFAMTFKGMDAQKDMKLQFEN